MSKDLAYIICAKVECTVQSINLIAEFSPDNQKDYGTKKNGYIHKSLS